MTTETLPAHARLAPSSSSRWLACPGSAQWDLPEDSSPKADAGTVAHNIVQDVMEGGGIYVPALLEADIYAGCLDIVGHDIAAGVAESASAYADVVLAMEGEKYHEIKAVHPFIPDFFGTIDTLVHYQEDMSVVDLKSGTYKVPAKGNTQLQCYALLGRHEFDFRGDVTGIIVQSRVYKRPQRAVFTTDQLDRFEDEVQAAGESDELKAGQHCKFCCLKPTCPAYQERYGDKRDRLSLQPASTFHSERLS